MNSTLVSRLFLFTRFGDNFTEEDTATLSVLMEEFATSGYRTGLEIAKDTYRIKHPGGCKMLSRGDECKCFLCQCDKAKKL